MRVMREMEKQGQDRENASIYWLNVCSDCPDRLRQTGASDSAGVHFIWSAAISAFHSQWVLHHTHAHASSQAGQFWPHYYQILTGSVALRAEGVFWRDSTALRAVCKTPNCRLFPEISFVSPHTLCFHTAGDSVTSSVKRQLPCKWGCRDIFSTSRSVRSLLASEADDDAYDK